MALKDESSRLVMTNYARRFATRILFSDMDAFRHLNNGATGRYFEEGRADLNVHAFGADHVIAPPDGALLLFATVTIDYIRQAHYPGSVDIGSGILKIGRTSYVIAQAAFQNGQCFALAQAVMVKAQDGQPSQISDEERLGLGRFPYIGAP